MTDHMPVTCIGRVKHGISNCLGLCDKKMKIRSIRMVELFLIVVLLWAASWLFVRWRQTPSPCPGSSSANLPVAGQSRVEDFHVKQDSGAELEIPVYIVEEHHEVIKYWFNAANKGYIKKKGNVLLHIDGHSDGGPPERWMLGPLFRYPASSEDITAMMQRNDVFILAAVLTGLINRFIWVFPNWSNSGMEGYNAEDYGSVRLRYGYLYRRDNDTGRLGLELCACATSVEFEIENYCFMNNAQFSEDQINSLPIKESECHIKNTGLVEIVRESKAISLIKSGTWITSEDSVLLDVDEDFYGVEASIRPLLDAGVGEVEIETISFWVERIVCALNTHQERQVDSFFNYLIQTIIDFKIICSMSLKDEDSICVNSSKLVSAAKKLQPEFMKNLRERNLDQYLCDPVRSKFALNQLILTFCNMNVDQLKALSEVGICLNVSPKTMDFKKMCGMRVCYGYNTPNDTMVEFHVPSLTEIDQRTDTLKDILKQKQFVPGAVTICRSTRDGYTPKKYFTKIESDVKLVLRDAFPRIRDDSFYYDKDLLGGPSGWHGRHYSFM
ncbi:uncharacterized protein LOC121378877 [Gigantopelta aegis]|uniref:uncharacterized protein LOC121378877 n=1 Tax=Gigantopelta aegis TaxID=1735272 RepID=UPI001B88BEBF|nr:uncharacterized protein LOC121378877 [Gigantopelta aegis]